MARVFSITAAATSLPLNSQGQAECSFTVSNTSGRRMRGRAEPRATSPAQQNWLSVSGETERDFPVNGTHQISVKVAVPPGSPPGKYAFRLDVVSTQNSDEDFAEGPSISFDVAAAPAKKPFPWWIVAAAVLVLVVGGVTAYLLLRTKAEETAASPPAEAAPVAAETAKPTPPPETAAPPPATPPPAPPPPPARAPDVKLPAVVDVAGRAVTYEGVTLNGQGNSIVVSPGQPVRLAFGWNLKTPGPTGLYCPGCIIQLYYGIDRTKGGFSKCIVSRVMGANSTDAGKVDYTFNAPAAPGTYYVTSAATMERNCREDVAPQGAGPANALAALLVR